MSCPGRLVLARRALGELDAEARAEIDAHVDGCAACRALAAEIEANLDSYAKNSDAELARLAAQLPRRRRAGLGWLLAPALTAAAAAALLLLWPTEEIGFKGAFAARVVAKRGDAQIVVRDQERLRPGDALRFVITSDPGYLSVVLVDARGRVWPFYPDTDPEQDARPWRIEAKGRHELPGSVVLDDSLGPERIVLIFSTRVFDRAEVHRRLAGLQGTSSAASLGLASAAVVRVVPVLKEAP